MVHLIVIGETAIGSQIEAKSICKVLKRLKACRPKRYSVEEVLYTVGVPVNVEHIFREDYFAAHYFIIGGR